MQKSALRPLSAVAILLLAAGCSTEKQAAPSGPPPNAKVVDQSKAGNVSGRVTIEGPVPANLPMNLSGDPYCARENPNGATFENFVVDNGGLENVFVYVKDSL